MKFQIYNVDIVQSVCIDIEGITTITGEQLTGKSIIAESLYYFINCVGIQNINYQRSINDFLEKTHGAFEAMCSNASQVGIMPHGTHVPLFSDDIWKPNLDKIKNDLFLLIVSPSDNKKIFDVLKEYCLDYMTTYWDTSVSNINQHFPFTADYDIRIGEDPLTYLVYVFIKVCQQIQEQQQAYLKQHLLFGKGEIENATLESIRLVDDENHNIIVNYIKKDHQNKLLLNHLVDFPVRAHFVDSFLIKKALKRTPIERTIYNHHKCTAFIQWVEHLNNCKVKAGDIIILDEPENGLHPANQVEYAKVIAEIQKKFGVRFVIVSNSPFFLRGIECYSNINGTSDTLNAYYLDHPDEYDANKCQTENAAYSKYGISAIYEDLFDPFYYLDDVILNDRCPKTSKQFQNNTND